MKTKKRKKKKDLFFYLNKNTCYVIINLFFKLPSTLFTKKKIFCAKINAVKKNPKSKTCMDTKQINVALNAYGILNFHGFWVGNWVLDKVTVNCKTLGENKSKKSAFSSHTPKSCKK